MRHEKKEFDVEFFASGKEKSKVVLTDRSTGGRTVIVANPEKGNLIHSGAACQAGPNTRLVVSTPNRTVKWRMCLSGRSSFMLHFIITVSH